MAHGLSAAGIGITGSILTSCGALRPHHQATAKARHERVAIVGAGIAGLAAASALRAEGFDDVVVLEARDRIGGRIWTSNFGGQPIDLGASWIHGVDGNPIARIAADNDIQILPTDYDNASTYFHGGDSEYRSRDDVVTGFWSFASQHPRKSLGVLFERYVNTSNLVDEDRQYLAYVLNTAIEHEFAADIGDLSLSSISGGEDWPGHDALFPGGYGQITDFLASGLDIRTSQAVTRIDYQGTEVVLTSAGGDRLEAATVVVTVPLGVLKKGVIAFVPELPASKRRAIDSLGMGVLNKTCLQFDEVFWPEDVELIGHIGTKPGRWAETVNLFVYTRQPILMMFNAGAYGAQIEAMSDAQIKGEALATLADMFGSVPPLRNALITRWQSDPWSYGSYSYVPVGSSWIQHEELAKPIDDRVVFAGEATHEDFPATVHGAYLSGIRAAREVATYLEQRTRPLGKRTRSSRLLEQ